MDTNAKLHAARTALYFLENAIRSMEHNESSSPDFDLQKALAALRSIQNAQAASADARLEIAK